MRSTCVALCAAAALGFTYGKDTAQAPRTPRNIAELASESRPFECRPCGYHGKVCCIAGTECTYNDDDEPVCVLRDIPATTAEPTYIANSATCNYALNESPCEDTCCASGQYCHPHDPGTCVVARGPVVDVEGATTDRPEIAWNTLSSTSAAEDATEWPTDTTDNATIFTTMTTEELIARAAEATTATIGGSIARAGEMRHASCNNLEGTRCANVCCGLEEDCADAGGCTPKYDGATATYGATGKGPLRPLETARMNNGLDYVKQGLGLTSWCDDQTDTCPLLCGGEPTANECYSPGDSGIRDPNAFQVLCVCADGSVPDRSQYIHTLEDHICQQERDDCLNKLLNAKSFNQSFNLDDQDRCFEKACAETEIRPSPFNHTFAVPANIKPQAVIAAQTTTINFPFTSGDGFHHRGSIVAVSGVATTIKLQCDYDFRCQEAAPTITMMIAPNNLDLYVARGSENVRHLACKWPDIGDTTCAESAADAAVTRNGVTLDATLSFETTTFGNEGASLVPLTVTAGAYKLVQATGDSSQDGNDMGVGGGSGDGGWDLQVSAPKAKGNAGASVQVGASAALVTLMLMLVLAL